MQALNGVDHASSDRELLRKLRRGASHGPDVTMMPESEAWQIYLELRRRGNERAEPMFLDTIRHLHQRRTLGSVVLSTDDPAPEDHRLVEVEDPFLADLWKAYKRCIQHNRTGPASQLLRDIEEQLARA